MGCYPYPGLWGGLWVTLEPQAKHLQTDATISSALNSFLSPARFPYFLFGCFMTLVFSKCLWYCCKWSFYSTICIRGKPWGYSRVCVREIIWLLFKIWPKYDSFNRYKDFVLVYLSIQAVFTSNNMLPWCSPDTSRLFSDSLVWGSQRQTSNNGHAQNSVQLLVS